VEEIDATVARMDAALDAAIARRPDFSPCEPKAVPSLATDGICVFQTNQEILRAVASREQFALVDPTFTPDHMVYCHDEAVFLESESELAEKTADYQARTGHLPKIIALKNIGLYACGQTETEAGIAMAVFLDALKISVFAESFGGAKPMCEALVREINNWEVERYRKSVSFGGGA